MKQTAVKAAGEIPGMWINAFTDGKEMIESLEDRMTGRYAAEDIVDPETGEVHC